MTKGDQVIGYCRVSTAEQGDSGIGLEAQREAIAAECQRHGWELLRVEEDVVSGRTTRRAGLQRALTACRAGEAAGVVFAKLDRATRSLLDFAAMVEEAEKRGYNLVAVDQQFDLATPHGRAMAGMLAVFAQLERDLISARTKAAMAVVRARGPKPGKKPIGRPPALSPELRRRIRTLRGRGWSFARIAERLNAEGVPTAHGGERWWPSTARAALR